MSGGIRKKVIRSQSVYKPVAAYSQAVVSNGIVYLSGVLGLQKPAGSDEYELAEGAAAQTRAAMTHAGKILAAAKSSYESILKVTIMMADIQDSVMINEVYQGFFKSGNFPARSAFQVAALPMGAAVEIDIIAKTEETTDYSVHGV